MASPANVTPHHTSMLRNHLERFPLKKTGKISDISHIGHEPHTMWECDWVMGLQCSTLTPETVERSLLQHLRDAMECFLTHPGSSLEGVESITILRRKNL